MNRVPACRIRPLNDQPVHGERGYVLYWMTACRRAAWNFSLDRAVELACELSRPLVVFEALRCDYPWASDRLHRFVIDGMIDNSTAFSQGRATYFPYLEPRIGAGKGLLVALASHAAIVITDDFPCFFQPRMMQAAAGRMDCRLEAVDSNGLLPLREAYRIFTRAVDFRRFLQRELGPHLGETPRSDPLGGIDIPRLKSLPSEVTDRWPPTDLKAWRASSAGLKDLPIDHSVIPTALSGGTAAARSRLDEFLGRDLDRYEEDRNDPDLDVSSRLSPWLHFGHVSAHEVFAALAQREGWTPKRLGGPMGGAKQAWWGMGSAAESFLDELVTWRELGFNLAWQSDDFDRYESLPRWAMQTLEEHARDHRPHTYSLEEFETAATHDELWNAAQRQLTREGRIHNYLRMLWGKKILEWTSHPREALRILIELNNKYALDGRDPNSYSGIFWVLGRYDRAWGPERPIFGKIRYMSSENTARKVNVRGFLRKYGALKAHLG